MNQSTIQLDKKILISGNIKRNIKKLKDLFERKGFDTKTSDCSSASFFKVSKKWEPDLILLECPVSENTGEEEEIDLTKQFLMDIKTGAAVIVLSNLAGLPGFDISLKDIENKTDVRIFRGISQSDLHELTSAVDDFFNETDSAYRDIPQILLVDDEPEIVETLDEYLTKEGFKVITAYNGKEALEKYYKHSPDVIISDYMMPEMDGLELLTEIRTFDNRTPIFILTSYDLALQSLRLRATDFIQKPADYDYIAFSVQRAINEKRAFEKVQKLNEGNIEFKAVKRFLYSLVPELENPLMSLIENTSSLLDEIKDKKQKEKLISIEISGKTMSGLISNLFSYSSLDINTMNITDVNYRNTVETVIVSMRQELHKYRGDELELEYSVPSKGNLEFPGDLARIEYVLRELITNAAKWTKKGKIFLKVTNSGNLIETSIQDPGEGIAEEIKDNIFIPGNTLNYMQIGTDYKNPFEFGKYGLGLGMASVKKIIDFHGGSIWYNSVQGIGTTCYFTISRQVGF